MGVDLDLDGAYYSMNALPLVHIHYNIMNEKLCKITVIKIKHR